MLAPFNTPFPPYTYLLRGYYYFRRKVPKDLRDEYKKPIICFSLRTKSPKQAMKRVLKINQQLEEFWFELRLNNKAIPASDLLLGLQYSEKRIPTLKEAVELYFSINGKGKSDTFYTTANRAVDYFLKSTGNWKLDKYQRSDVNRVRDKLLKKGLAPQSVRRMFSVLKTVFSLNINEYSLEMPNIFQKVQFGKDIEIRERRAIPIDGIRKIQTLCREKNDYKRWVISLISDTGMRLSEALGLRVEDLYLEEEVPYVYIRTNSIRRLKTGSSERKVPLVSEALWAAKQIKQNKNTEYLFPHYIKEGKLMSNSASAALNKWLKTNYKKEYVMHCFRHSFRDRLRAVQCPSDIVDQVGGWTGNKTVGQGYGSGYPLSVIYEWLLKI